MKIFPTLALSTLTLLLAACGPQTPVTPTDPATTPPPSPTAQSLDIMQMPVKAQEAAVTLNGMVTPGPDMDEDLQSLLALLTGSSSPMPTALNFSSPAALGQEVARQFGRRSAATGIRALGTRDYPLPTGTETVSASGVFSFSPLPTTGYIVDNQQRGVKVEINWRVGSAATEWAERAGFDGVTERVELPTRASATLLRGSTLAAQASLNLASGGCFYLTGPTALSFSGWAGKQTSPAAKAALDYAWTDAGITARTSATYKTKTRTASLDAALDIRGITTNRCDPTNFSFTPARADLSGTVNLPGQEVEAKVYLRDLGNLTFSMTALNAQNPFQNIKGTLNAGVKYNGRAALSAFGPLADGGDLDLQPGDQVRVKYVRNGVLVDKSLPEALADLQP